ncbi:17838_t:CDS:2 [Funneliformis geosporum]|nr:17838_t:CDS:2 [Funneliformis geosporum]
MNEFERSSSDVSRHRFNQYFEQQKSLGLSDNEQITKSSNLSYQADKSEIQTKKNSGKAS